MTLLTFVLFSLYLSNYLLHLLVFALWISQYEISQYEIRSVGLRSVGLRSVMFTIALRQRVIQPR
jgi:hypothetical protein